MNFESCLCLLWQGQLFPIPVLDKCPGLSSTPPIPSVPQTKEWQREHSYLPEPNGSPPSPTYNQPAFSCLNPSTLSLSLSLFGALACFVLGQPFFSQSKSVPVFLGSTFYLHWGLQGLLIWLYLKGLRREGEWENPGYRVCLQVANVEGSKGQRSGTGSDEKQDLLFLALFPNLTFQGARLVGLFLPVSLIRPKPLKIYLMTL